MSVLRVGVLCSGAGSLLEAIVGDAGPYEVVAVATDRPGVRCIDVARRAGIEAAVHDYASFGSREAFSKALGEWMAAQQIGLAVHAGFMRILTAEYFSAVGVPAMNSHPALLPAFPGAHGVRDALAWGVKVAGTTIHFATEDLDMGPIILQEAVEVRPDDDEASLHERIKGVERRLYPEAIRLYAAGRLTVEGRRVRIAGARQEVADGNDVP